MSVLLDKAREHARQAGPLAIGEGDLPHYREGKAFAAEVIAELRAGAAHPRLLFVAVGMSAFAGEAFSAGLHAELQRVVAASKEDTP